MSEIVFPLPSIFDILGGAIANLSGTDSVEFGLIQYANVTENALIWPERCTGRLQRDSQM